eukprot:2281826-Alexandrium_andersonii.AAC.1
MVGVGIARSPAGHGAGIDSRLAHDRCGLLVGVGVVSVAPSLGVGWRVRGAWIGVLVAAGAFGGASPWWRSIASTFAEM